MLLVLLMKVFVCSCLYVLLQDVKSTCIYNWHTTYLNVCIRNLSKEDFILKLSLKFTKLSKIMKDVSSRFGISLTRSFLSSLEFISSHIHYLSSDLNMLAFIPRPCYGSFLCLKLFPDWCHYRTTLLPIWFYWRKDLDEAQLEKDAQEFLLHSPNV